MKMRTIAKAGKFEIWQDMSGSILMNGKQFDDSMSAAWSATDPERKQLIEQVYAANGAYLDGPAAFEHWKKVSEIDENGFKESTTESVTVEGGSDE